MRLIDARTLRIQEFSSEDAYPPYAILSHTWGSPEQECTLHGMTEPDVSSRIGYTKIKLCCDQALRDGLSWAWVDTCCIDKTSTAELSEAINSMFKWYKKASICYAYIEDANTVQELKHSRWFTRGWTLQELVAPHDVVFFSKSWALLGRKLELKDVLWKITGIEPAVLEAGTLSNVTVAKKMSWAANRKTTRVEDLAYCLLGIFDVNMPMLYGEGKKSFIRLQEEIMKSSYDHTLFAWSRCPLTRTADAFVEGEATSHPHSEPKALFGLLAESPTLFLHSKDIVPLEDNFQSGNDVTSGSGRIAIRLPAFRKGAQLFAALPCVALSSYLAVPLDSWDANFVARQPELVLASADDSDLYDQWGQFLIRRFHIKPPIQGPICAQPPPLYVPYIVNIACQDHSVYRMSEVYCSFHAMYDRNASELVVNRGHIGLHAACLLEPKRDKILPQRGFYHHVAILIGGDLRGDGKPWVVIVPVLPDTNPDEAFHEMRRQNPALTTLCGTENMLIDKLTSRSDNAIFSRVGCQEVKDWLIGEDQWGSTLPLKRVRSDYRADKGVKLERFIFVGVKSDKYVLEARPAVKAFKVAISFVERRDRGPECSC